MKKGTAGLGQAICSLGSHSTPTYELETLATVDLGNLAESRENVDALGGPLNRPVGVAAGGAGAPWSGARWHRTQIHGPRGGAAGLGDEDRDRGQRRSIDYSLRSHVHEMGLKRKGGAKRAAFGSRIGRALDSALAS